MLQKLTSCIKVSQEIKNIYSEIKVFLDGHRIKLKTKGSQEFTTIILYYN